MKIRSRAASTLAAGALGLCLSAVLVEAQEVPPVPALPAAPSPDSVGGDSRPDTDYTPVAKESGLWQPVQGARFDATGPETEGQYEARAALVAGSASELVTSFDDDLTDVHFMNARNGFAGGQRKVDCDGDGAPETFVPVIYRYGDSSTGLRWLPPGADAGGVLGDCDRPGFVGQLTWIRETGMALAVGGTGSFPHRERAYSAECSPPGKPYGANCDQAGTGRAWLYNHGVWQELDEDPKRFPLPSGPDEWDGLRGMTALDFSPLPGKNFGFAGALGQIWPVVVKIEGQSGPCPDEDANDCVSFPADGKIPDLGTDGRAEMNASTYTRPAVGPVAARQESNTIDGFRFRFRVRQIRVQATNSARRVAAVAVTSGCCAGVDASRAAEGGGAGLGPAHNYPSLLTFEQSPDKVPSPSGQGAAWRWRVRPADPNSQSYERAPYVFMSEEQRRALPPPNRRQDLPDSFYSITAFLASGGSGDMYKVSMLAAPGGPPADGGAAERPSVVSEPYCVNGDVVEQKGSTLHLQTLVDGLQPGELFTALRTQLSSVRLVDGDGDDTVAFTPPASTASLPNWPPAAGAPSNAGRTNHQSCSQGQESRRKADNVAERNRHDAVPDWAVGELRSSEVGGLGARGLAFSTVSRPTLIPDTLDVGLYGDDVADFDPSHLQSDPANYRPTTPEKLAAFLQSQYFFTGSYGLNALDYIDGSGQGWAVGAHGGIAQLGGSGDLSARARPEPDPPRLTDRRPGAAPDRSPYEALDRSVTQPGPVPALATRVRERRGEPVFGFAGAPDATVDYANGNNELGQLVLSRDGSEGWGLDSAQDAAGGLSMTLFRLSAGAWRRCDPEGIDGVLAADLACSALAPLRDYSIKGAKRGVRIAAAARIPLERDDDPGNDDEFEVLALATGYRTPEEAAADPEGTVSPALLRYRGGAWQVEDDRPVRDFLAVNVDYQSTLNQQRFSADMTMAFASPSDGWIISTNARAQPSNKFTSSSRLLHFDGGRWVTCSAASAGGGAGDSNGDSGGPAERAEWCDDPEGLTVLGAGSDTGQELDQLNGLTVAGDRLFAYGTRTVGGVSYPLVLCKDAGGSWRSAGCGLDPGLAVRFPETVHEPEATRGLEGEVTALSVAVDDAGVARGWATGSFQPAAAATTAFLRLDGRGWLPFADRGPLRDGIAATGGALGRGTGIFAEADGGGLLGASGFWRFDRRVGGWRPLPGVPPGSSSSLIVPDNRGGAWVGMPSPSLTEVGSGGGFPDDLAHYTPTPPEPVFSEAPAPLVTEGDSLTALVGEPDGSLWAATTGSVLYRYERTTGWDRLAIPGWQSARATVSPPAYAVAVNDAGVGVVVGHEGRIANVADATVELDDAAGVVCDLAAVAAPCGTSRHLRAAAVAPDGSAMVAGDQVSLLWRPAGGAFRAIAKPELAPSADIAGVSLPSPDAAYLATSTGAVFHGVRSGESWSWQLDNTDERGSLLTRDAAGSRGPLGLHAVAVDASGHGYAAGEDGVLLERTGDGGQPWRRVRSGVSDDLTVVVLAGGGGALLGGEEGVVLTGEGDAFHIAKPPDRDGGHTGDVVGLAVSGGPVDGQTEAWAASAGRGVDGGSRSVSQLFHYASDPTEPLLDPAGDLEPLPDAPAPRTGEVSFAALGKTDCHRQDEVCPSLQTGYDYAVASRRAAEEIATRSEAAGGLALAVFSGDIADEGGSAGAATTQDAAAVPSDLPSAGSTAAVALQRSGVAKLAAARSWIAEPLARAGVGFFSALGGQDLSGRTCPGGTACIPTPARAGVSDAWRRTFAAEAPPWGAGDQRPSSRYEVRPVAGSGGEIAAGDQTVDTGAVAGEKQLFLSGARTHYAFDLIERGGDRQAARFVFADNSLRSLAASDPLQNPVEAGGQAQWLKSVLCFKDTADGCTRPEGLPAIVVANAPTYSYSQTSPDALATDATTFEQVLLENQATSVVSGSLGWNGRYWATAPGVHVPCPGDGYIPDDEVPEPETRACGQAAPDEAAAAVDSLSRALTGTLGPPPPPADALAGVATGSGLLPVVVASGAGGELGDNGVGSAGDGFWHGYSIVRVPADGDPRKLIVEQRPIYDYVTIRAASHVLQPGQKLTLRGIGRGPLAYDSATTTAPRSTRFDAIDSAAVTHRYDLLEADPEKPWLPKVVSDNGNPHGYVPLDPTVASVDSQSGVVRAGRSNHGRVYALALLSVGEKAATYPLVFEPKRSYTPKPQPRIAAPVVPEIRVLGFNASSVQPPTQPPPATTPPPLGVNLQVPTPPSIPSFPGAAAPPVTPPVPPAPPAPPGGQSSAPIDLSINPAGLTVPPTTGVTAQPTPPVNPSPPGGARKEARQKQAATAKSEEGSAGATSQESAGDLSQSPGPPGGVAMARRDRIRAEPGSFSAVARRPQASAWTTGLQWGGGIGLMALAAALGYSTLRPTPRRGPPVVPAPAWARRRR